MFRDQQSPTQLWRLQSHITISFSPNWEDACPSGLCPWHREAESPQPTSHSLSFQCYRDGVSQQKRQKKKLNGGMGRGKRLIVALFSIIG